MRKFIKDTLKANWIIICYHDNEDGTMNIVHSVVYEHQPTDKDVKALRDELSIDNELGMTDDIDYKMMKLNRQIAPQIFEQLSIPEYFEL